MIKVNKVEGKQGCKVYLEGDHIELLAELTFIVESLNEHLTEEYKDEKQAKYLIEKSVELGFMSKEETHKKAMEALNNMNDFIESFMKGVFK